MRETIVKIVAGALLLAAAVVVEKTCNLPAWALLLVYLVPYLVVGFDTLKEAAEGIVRGELFDEHFLMAVATVGALCIGFLPGAQTQFPEAVFVMLFFQVGELFESIAEGRSRKSIAELMDIRPDVAHVERAGEEQTVGPDDVCVGETIFIRPGEKVPLDGVVVEGDSSLNTVALTGESMPRGVHVGDDVASGCVNLTGLLRVRVTKPFGESTVSKVLELVENAGDHKSHRESFITRFARVYTPVVVFAAVALAFIPPLFSGSGYLQALPTWLYRALTFLVVSCPCALVISVPLTFFGGIGGASRKGVLVKGSNYLEALARVGIAVFDKTGTLTEGVFSVGLVHPQELTATELLHMAAHVERYSNHPIALSLREAYPDEDDGCAVEQIEEVAGQGVKARVNGKEVCVGNGKLMEAVGAQWHECSTSAGETTCHVAIDGEYVGHIHISDHVKDDAVQAVSELKEMGVRRTVMLTGDHRAVGEQVAARLGIDELHAELLPADKVACVERLMAEKDARKTLAFVGDGINDAPVLARADVGIAMGALGSDAAIEAADVVIMDDRPSKLSVAIRSARRTLRIANENVWFSIGIKVLVLLLAAFGLAGMWMAVFADVGVTVLAVLNAMRTLR
ncbi:MAG: cadmium-translocating P-type ATPase [Bacteroidaceae bacterium]|nr:cadmium-translocating P-type ATPase [Bacteroidaceae bacterium]